ncbi:NYN domain-containing protein [Patescibacteria group bacterium]|nr:NYN domain-containing protein [Patescibacteria group bacterium]
MNSMQFIKDAKKLKYEVITKPVKIMQLSIDVSSIPNNSPVILSKFIHKSLLRHFDLATVEYLNNKLKDFNMQGVREIEHRKCNFDVEIGRDMFLDFERNGIETFILWSGDSNFADPVKQLLKDKKKVVIFATARRISVELSETKALIFDIQKIRNFICRSSEIQKEIKKKL